MNPFKEIKCDKYKREASASAKTENTWKETIYLKPCQQVYQNIISNDTLKEGERLNMI